MTNRRPRMLSVHDALALPQLRRLSPADRAALEVVSLVLPFRVNSYVVDELIDWDSVPEDPIYQLTFMQRDMLNEAHYRALTSSREANGGEATKDVISRIRRQLNPHPDGQVTLNVPSTQAGQLAGVQHKYRETCLLFPKGGQTCHAYCTYCFRWPQFVGDDDLRFVIRESHLFHEYLAAHDEITDVLFTGGDPLVMSTHRLARYVDPLLTENYRHISSIRIGTKSLTYWPYRFTTDDDADELLRLFEKVVSHGKHLAVMAHVSHPRELETSSAREAVRRVRATGAEIRTQAPLVRHVNDSAVTWSRKWREEVRQGCIPYYMFVARETGASPYFRVPLYEALGIFREAFSRVSGLARTVRGPCMSTTAGKIVIDGITQIDGDDVFVLSFIQAREPDRVRRPFFAKLHREATWFDQLVPATSHDEPFFE